MSVQLALSECEAPLRARLRGEEAAFTGVSIDTRTLAPGNLFVAIPGERVDGHDFAAEAAAAGASALLVEHAVESALPQLIVSDSVSALGALARLWLTRHSIPLVAITGSNGKTTTKEIVTAILSRLGPVLSTQGNLNNDIGVPLTLLRLNGSHRYAVVEMGASRAGDIARLVAIAPPDVAVVTGTGAAHLEGFGSLEGVARAKSEIFDGLTRHGTAVYGLDDPRAAILAERAEAHATRTFGVSASADVRGVAGPDLQFEALGQRHRARFELLGDHNGMNALAAVAAVQSLDVQPAAILSGLSAVKASGGRLQPVPCDNGLQLIDDSYNANPVSVRAAIELLARRQGTRHLVLGDMLELGEQGPELHADAGRLAKRLGIDRLWALGPLASVAAQAFGPGGQAHDTFEALETALLAALHDGETVLVKGSRGARMERVVAALSQGKLVAPRTRAAASPGRLHEGARQPS